MVRLARIEIMQIYVVITSPFYDGTTGKFRAAITDEVGRLTIDTQNAPNSRASLAPGKPVSAIKHTFSRQQSSFTVDIRNLRDAANVSGTKSKGHVHLAAKPLA